MARGVHRFSSMNETMWGPLAACVLLGCGGQGGAGIEVLNEQGGPTCEVPAGDAVSPVWFQVPCDVSSATGAGPTIVETAEDWDRLAGEEPCLGSAALSGIDFDTQRAVLFDGLGRITFVVEDADTIFVGMETYAGPAPGSQGEPVAIIPKDGRAIAPITCAGSEGCTADGMCPPTAPQ